MEFEFSDTIIPLIIGIIGHILFRFSILGVRLEEKSKSYAKISIINKALYACLAIVLVYVTNNRSFQNLAIATVIAILVASAFALFELKNIWLAKTKKNNYDVRLSELAKYGVPFIAAMGLTTLFEAIDKLSLNTYCDYSTVGVYTGAINIVNVFAIIQTTFNTLWAPVSIKHYEENPNDTAFYSKCNLLITFIVFIFGFTLILFKDLFGLLLGDRYREAAYIIPFLTLHPIMYTVSETTVTGIVVTKRSKLHIVTAAVSCFVNFIGNTILVPIIGGKGAAISTGVSYILFYALRTLFGMKYFHFETKQVRYILITLIYIIYAAYNTFCSFGLLSIVMYIASVIVLIMLYKDEAKNIVTIGLGMIKK
jgi:O-antigen/teichoic acid export membrane protein